MPRLHLHIYGQVQGVFYRASAQAEAQRLGLTGWVRNRADGSVELVAEGREAALHRLRDWCRHGPSGARVDRINEAWETTIDPSPDFSIRC